MKQHSPRFLALVNETKKNIKEITLQALKNKLDNQEQCVLIDVREDNEWLTGYIPTAMHISKGVIERDIEKNIPDAHSEIIVYCSGGFRSALVANTLQNMGYSNVYSLSSGMQGWIDEGYNIKK